jgi:N-glycosylase/DNA lyase
VGDKVANCANLFGLGHLEAFPIDVWMKRALKENFPPDFDPAVFGANAGLAQQYIFYYARSEGK